VNRVYNKNKKTNLTATGLLMEGVNTQTRSAEPSRHSTAINLRHNRVNLRYWDFSRIVVGSGSLLGHEIPVGVGVSEWGGCALRPVCPRLCTGTEILGAVASG